MRKYLLFIILVLLLGLLLIAQRFLLKAGVCGYGKETATVTMKDEAFEPDKLAIKKCTKVVFKNSTVQSHWPASNLHPTHGIYPEFDPQAPIEPGKEWIFVFEKTGSWNYHDHLVPSTRGVIEVSN